MRKLDALAMDFGEVVSEIVNYECPASAKEQALAEALVSYELDEIASLLIGAGAIQDGQTRERRGEE